LQKILIIQTAFIGDVILSIPLIRVISQNFPEAEIHFLTIPASKNTVETLPYISKLWIYDKHNQEKGLIAFLRLIKQIRSANFDMVITPHRSLRTALLGFLSGISVRIGFKSSVGWVLYTNRVEYLSKFHEIERNLRLVEPLNINIGHKELPEINITEQDQSKVDQWFEEQKILNQHKIIAMASGSVWFTKRWPSDYFRKLGEKISESGYRVIFIGSKQDQYLYAEINKHNYFITLWVCSLYDRPRKLSADRSYSSAMIVHPPIWELRLRRKSSPFLDQPFRNLGFIPMGMMTTLFR